MYNYENNETWTVKTTQDDFKNFVDPYIGNGHMGSTFTKLLFSTSFNKPLSCLIKNFYDNGILIPIPSWNTIEVTVEKTKYSPSEGKHNLVQTLDLRSATVTMIDKWEYVPCKYITIEATMIIPRQYKSGSCLSLKIKSKEEATLKFGLLGKNTIKHANLDFTYTDEYINGTYTTNKNSKTYYQQLTWSCENIAISNIAKRENDIEVTAKTSKGIASLQIFHTFVDCLGNDAQDMIDDGIDKIIFDNTLIWRKIWDNAIAFNENFKTYAKMLLVHQFYLLSSFSEIGDYVVCPTGLSSVSWGGVQFWDTDLYMFRAMLAINPALAKSSNDFRYKTLENAKIRATINGFKGARYPWESDNEGLERTPVANKDEIHVNIWVALAMWEYYLETKDIEYLAQKGYPVISGVADFLSSWGYYENDGMMHMHMVVPPDETVCEKYPGRCNDNFLTNFGSKRIMEAAIKCCALLGIKPNEKWDEFISKIYIPKAEENGIIKEFREYEGQNIKQADLILAFYPLDYNIDKNTIKKNLEYYHEKVDNGPAMTSQIESIIRIKYLDYNRDKEIVRMFEEFIPNISGPHFMAFERPVKKGPSPVVFLTAIGAELQAIIYGYYGCEPGDYSTLPRIIDSN